MKNFKILEGDVRAMLATLESESVQMVCTSPPYWSLRDYRTEPQVWGGDSGHAHEWGELLSARPGRGNAPGDYSTSSLTNPKRQDEVERSSDCGSLCSCGAWRGQLGLEPTPALYVEHLVAIFREVRRVLRNDGTLWLNLGDSYAGSGKGGNPAESSYRKQATNVGSLILGNSRPPAGLKCKDLVGIPWRVAFALQADGWWLRSDIIWAKLNPMPESVTDRPTKAHEYLFLLSKNVRYYYDAGAIKESFQTDPDENYQARSKVTGRGGLNSSRAPLGAPRRDNSGGFPPSSDGRNKRSVWTIATEPFPEAHFATFPQALVEPCVLAGTSIQACEVCSAPWKRVIKPGERQPELDRNPQKRLRPGQAGNVDAGNMGFRASKLSGQEQAAWKLSHPDVTIDWQPTCKHENAGSADCLVLDPFCGSGTVGVVALRHGRRFLGIDLSKAYCEMAHRRIAGPLFTVAKVESVPEAIDAINEDT